MTYKFDHFSPTSQAHQPVDISLPSNSIHERPLVFTGRPAARLASARNRHVYEISLAVPVLVLVARHQLAPSNGARTLSAPEGGRSVIPTLADDG